MGCLAFTSYVPGTHFFAAASGLHVLSSHEQKAGGQLIKVVCVPHSLVASVSSSSVSNILKSAASF